MIKSKLWSLEWKLVARHHGGSKQCAWYRQRERDVRDEPIYVDIEFVYIQHHMVIVWWWLVDWGWQNRRRINRWIIQLKPICRMKHQFCSRSDSTYRTPIYRKAASDSWSHTASNSLLNIHYFVSQTVPLNGFVDSLLTISLRFWPSHEYSFRYKICGRPSVRTLKWVKVVWINRSVPRVLVYGDWSNLQFISGFKYPNFV